MSESTLEARLNDATCRQLLATQRFGRVALTRDGEIDLVPVEYAVERDMILFRALTAQSLPLGADGLFDVDQAPGDTQGGWSVTVAGRMDKADVNELESLPRRLANDCGLLWLPIERLAGHRIAPVADHGDPGGAQTWSGRDASDLIG